MRAHGSVEGITARTASASAAGRRGRPAGPSRIAVLRGRPRPRPRPSAAACGGATLPARSSAAMASGCVCATMAPWSNRSGCSVCTVTPVHKSPSSSARWIGALPLCLGSSDGCTFSASGTARTRSPGISFPNETAMIALNGRRPQDPAGGWSARPAPACPAWCRT